MTSYNKLPKTLERIDPKIISINAKYIYTLMLNRHNLSRKNQWIDADGNVYIYFTLFDVQKAIGVSEKTAIKVLKELENNGLIIRKRQGQGNPARTYLSDPELEHTEINKTVNNTEKDKKCQKDTFETKPKAEKCQNNVSEKKQEKEENKEISKVIDTFKRFFGREPDKSFKKTIQKRIQESNLKIATIKSAIEKAFQVKAKKPEAFILYLTQFNTYNEVQEVPAPEPAKDAPLEEWEIEWMLEIERNDENAKPERIKKLEQMLALIRGKKAEEEAKRPLEDWEIDWLNEQKRYEQSCENEGSEIIPPEVPSYLLE